MAGHERPFHNRPICDIASRVAGPRIGQAGGTLDCLRRMWYAGDGLYVEAFKETTLRLQGDAALVVH